MSDASTEEGSRKALFAAPGIMSARCRTFDWGSTALGPVSGWSQSLRTIVAAVMDSRHPMFLWWGDDLVQIFNDGYLPSFGSTGRDLAALGAKGREHWVDVWPVIGPQIEQVMTIGEATWHEDQLIPIERNGHLEEVYWTYGYSPVRDDDGHIAGVLVAVQETTSRVKAVADAEAARNDAMIANRVKSEFLANMSHELRTPLNAIAGYAQLLEMGVHGPVTDAQLVAIRRIQRSEQHLLALVNDVLNFAKLEAGRVKYNVSDVLLTDVVAIVTPMVEPQIASKGIRFDVGIADGLAVRADIDKLQQILLNLMSNAIKFTAGGGSITIDSRDGSNTSRVAGDVIFLRVTDTGIGIPRDRQDSVFDPFVQIDRHRNSSSDGTGLGLSISRDLARGMGGELRVRSTVGEGSCFTVILPAA